MAEQNAYGGFWIRFLAYLVDSVVFFTLLVALAAGAAFLGDLGSLVITAAAIVGPLLYWGLMQASGRQATWVHHGGNSRPIDARTIAGLVRKAPSASRTRRRSPPA